MNSNLTIGKICEWANVRICTYIIENLMGKIDCSKLYLSKMFLHQIFMLYGNWKWFIASFHVHHLCTVYVTRFGKMCIVRTQYGNTDFTAIR